MKTDLTEASILRKLTGPFPGPAFTVLPHVRNGTGYSRKKIRTADALVISSWPSRGLWIGGVEVKISRSDFKRELADPLKSAEIQQYCRYWWLAAPTGMIAVGEVPETWGLIDVGASCKIVKPAPELPAKPPDISLLAAICRAIEDNHVSKGDLDYLVKDRAAKEGVMATRTIEELRKTIEAFEVASGLDIHTKPWTAGRVGSLVKIVEGLKLDGGLALLRDLHDKAELVAEESKKLLKNLNAKEVMSWPCL